MKKGDILSLSKDYEVTWKDGYPIKIQLTQIMLKVGILKFWNFQTQIMKNLKMVQLRNQTAHILGLDMMNLKNTIQPRGRNETYYSNTNVSYRMGMVASF